MRKSVFFHQKITYFQIKISQNFSANFLIWLPYLFTSKISDVFELLSKFGSSGPILTRFSTHFLVKLINNDWSFVSLTINSAQNFDQSLNFRHFEIKAVYLKAQNVENFFNFWAWFIHIGGSVCTHICLLSLSRGSTAICNSISNIQIIERKNLI